MSNIIINISGIDDIKPSLSFVESTSGTFQASTLTYNDAATTYSSSSAYYGGRDVISGAAPLMHSVFDVSTTPGTIILKAGQPMGPGFFLYVTYPTSSTVTL